MIVIPDSDDIKTAPYLSVCEQCIVDYGSCSLFKVLELNSTTNDCRKACTRKDAEERDDEDKDENQSDDEDEGESETEYHASDTVCTVAADQNSFDPFYFIYIIGSDVAEFDVMDDINHLIKKDQHYISGYYLEKHFDTTKGKTYSVNTKKNVFFYKESIVHPFVNFVKNQNGKRKTMFISNEDYCEVIYFLEETKMSMIV